MRTLKDLTPEECVKIASIARPNIQWKFIQSKYKWDGFDLVEEDCEYESMAKYIFQIDYRIKELIGSHPRFKFYDDLYGYSVSDKLDSINEYLKSIGVDNPL